MTATTNLLSLSGAQLREGAATNPAYAAELARRIAKREASGKVTEAALRSWGRTGEADAMIAHAKAAKAAAKATAPAKAPKAEKVAPAPKAEVAVVKPKVAAFTRTNERVDALNTRVQSIEGSILALAASQASMKEVLDLIAKKLVA